MFHVNFKLNFIPIILFPYYRKKIAIYIIMNKNDIQ